MPISAILFGGCRSTVVPLVFQSLSRVHVVFFGATMTSETTAASTGAVGVVRHDPMAMLPFCGYNIGDYFAHWLQMGQRLQAAPLVFRANWFRMSEDGRHLWPGYGENLRLLRWIISRVHGEIAAVETPIGFLPRSEDIDTRGIKVSPAAMKELLTVDREGWRQAAAGQQEFFSTFGDRLPRELWQENEALIQRLQR